MPIKFRAYQLDSPGSLFSLYKSNKYYLIEARIPKGGLEVLQKDMVYHGKNQVDVLHITSWDNDHCNSDDLMQILNFLRPQRIEFPDYQPESTDGQLCLRLIKNYEGIHQPTVINLQPVSKAYIDSLSFATAKDFSDVVMHSSYDSCRKNDMSLIKLFRSPGFNVLSLGDCESSEIAGRLMQYDIVRTEVDVLILPHHGANNGFLTGELLDVIKPKIAICSANNCNQYDHPHQEIRNILSSRGIPLYTTKRGDVVVRIDDGASLAQVLSLISDNSGVDKNEYFTPKRFIV